MRWDRVFSIAPFGGLETPGFAGKKNKPKLENIQRTHK
jgi:hypothetical protein